MHVRPGAGDIPEGRRFENAPVLRIVRDLEATYVRVRLVRPNTDVVILVCGEVSAFMAGIALRFVLEDIPAADLRGRHRVLIPGLIAIVGRAARKNSPLEG